MRTRRKGRWLLKQPRLGARMCQGTFFFLIHNNRMHAERAFYYFFSSFLSSFFTSSIDVQYGQRVASAATLLLQ